MDLESLSVKFQEVQKEYENYKEDQLLQKRLHKETLIKLTKEKE